jgi:hypothetical protein
MSWLKFRLTGAHSAIVALRSLFGSVGEADLGRLGFAENLLLLGTLKCCFP